MLKLHLDMIKQITNSANELKKCLVWLMNCSTACCTPENKYKLTYEAGIKAINKWDEVKKEFDIE